MKTLLTTAAGLALCVSLPAQGSMTTPAGGLKGEGAQYAYLMGLWADMHIQQADDNHSDGKAKSLSEIAFRLDNRSHSSTTASGRTWTRITLDISEPTTFNSMGTSFASNHGTSVTRVFDSKWTWPAQNGFPLLKPDVWGGVSGQLRFPFTKPWVYNAKGSILMDYTFRGGTLANSASWSSLQAAYFFLDSESINTTAAIGSVTRVPATPPLCNDSAISFATAAYTYGYAYAYGKNSPTITLRGRLVFQHYSYYTAPDAPVIQALGAGGIPNGVNIGARCNNLYLDVSKPTIFMTFKTIAPYGYSGVMGYQPLWRSEFSSLDLWLQAAWNDSATKEFKLTSATNVTLPSGLPPDQLPRYKTVYQRDSVSTTGFGPVQSGVYFPYTRYKVQ